MNIGSIKKERRWSNYLPVIFLPVFLSFIGCTTDDLYDTTNKNYFAQADASVYLTSFPSPIYLEEGKSIYIENGQSTFRFIDVREDNESNAAVRIEIIYNYGTNRIIELNTNVSPQFYELENDYPYNIHLKELNYVNGTYQIMFQYNHHAHWLQ